ncbi:MAG TPA: FecR family protein, partial [Niabella sp.]|nr:FecR family protein [Niabella sp.]
RGKATKMILEAQQLTDFRKKNRFTFYRYAAAITVLFVIGIGAYYIYQPDEKKMEATLYFPAADSVEGNTITYKVRPGDTIKKVQLPDSSFVYLNTNASLSVDSGRFNLRNRDVVLDHGEAFFDVAKNAEKIFTVQLGNLVLEVVGTSFNIENNEIKAEKRVFVKTGKVLIKDKEKLIASLTPHEVFTYNNKTKEYAIKKNATTDLSQWTSGGLVFEGADWNEIKQKIKNRFNVDLAIENNALPPHIELNAIFSKEDSYSEIAKIIAGIYGARFRTEEYTIIFFK